MWRYLEIRLAQKLRQDMLGAAAGSTFVCLVRLSNGDATLSRERQLAGVLRALKINLLFHCIDTE